ncbi:MAG TPA: hypothetical protein VIY08_01525 [Candidatus Nitrosocosmicus sp.]
MNIRGNISIDFNQTPLLSVDFKDEVLIDIKDTSIFDLIEMDGNKKDDSSFWDVLHNARDFAEDLTNRHITIILSVRGKETLVLGEKAKPSISQILSKSKHIEIKNVFQAAKISKELLD